MFIVEVSSRMVVGWQAAHSLRTDLAIDALDMAVHVRGRTNEFDGLIHHSDRGVQGGFKWSSQHLQMRSWDGTFTWVTSDGDRTLADVVAGTTAGCAA